MPKSYDELMPEELPEIGLYEGDRPIQTYDYLGSTEEGKAICMFPMNAERIPSRIIFKMPGLEVTDLIQELIIKNPSGKGLATSPYNSIADDDKPLPKKIFGVVIDDIIIKQMLGTKEDGSANTDNDGIQLAASNDLTPLTLAQWTDKFHSDGLATVIMARLFNRSRGGGVETPGQQVTGTHQKGQPRSLKDKIIKKLGKW